MQVSAISVGFLPAVDAVPHPPKSDIWQRSSLNVNILNEYIGQNNSSKSIKRIPKQIVHLFMCCKFPCSLFGKSGCIIFQLIKVYFNKLWSWYRNGSTVQYCIAIFFFFKLQDPTWHKNYISDWFSDMVWRKLCFSDIFKWFLFSSLNYLNIFR